MKECTSMLMLVDVESGSLDNVTSSFEAGRRILSFFPANEAITALASLESQFNQHTAFKNGRIAALGWCGPSAAVYTVPASILDPQAALAVGQGATAVLKSILDDPQGSSTAAAFSILCSAVKSCDERVKEEQRCRRYHEAQMLKVISSFVVF
jgi:hypothetical protein